MATMRCVVVREHGGFDRLLQEERDVPTPRRGEVRVRVRAVGLNHLDTWVRRGVPGHTFPLPLVTSSDASGVVATRSSAANMAIQRDVMGSSTVDPERRFEAAWGTQTISSSCASSWA